MRMQSQARPPSAYVSSLWQRSLPVGPLRSGRISCYLHRHLDPTVRSFGRRRKKCLVAIWVSDGILSREPMR